MRVTAVMEILAPAGSPESLQAAVRAGADAVYLGYTYIYWRARLRITLTTTPCARPCVTVTRAACAFIWL